tara:strand:- start:190 stop:738 length:549 start_codon:yes stop_codon:yes gene_type:complete
MGISHSVELCENIKKEIEMYGIKNCKVHIKKQSIDLIENKNFLMNLKQNFRFTKDKELKNLSYYTQKSTNKEYVYEYEMCINGKKGVDDVEISLKINLTIEKDDNGYWCIYNPFGTFHPIRFEYRKNGEIRFFWYIQTMNKIESFLLQNIPYMDVYFFEKKDIMNVIKQYVFNEQALLYENK